MLHRTRAAGKLLFEHPHHQDVLVAPLPKKRLPEPPFFTEAALQIRPNGSRVEVENVQEHSMEVKLLEAKADEQAHRFGAVAFAEVFPAPDDDSDLGKAVSPIDVVAAESADAQVRLTKRDGERAVQRIGPGELGFDEPLRLPQSLRKDSPREESNDFRVVDPAVNDGDVFLPELAEHDPVAFNPRHG